MNNGLPLKNPEHLARQQAQAAHLKLTIKNQLAAIRREEQIKIQQERERNYKCSDSVIRYDALHAAAYYSNAGQL
tara:strand:- start:210 stop:434 length:225 start_codon:yes stop_codon:yes gene_type:complete